MKKILIILIIFFFSTNAFATLKQKIIKNLSEIENLNFDFEQNINGKIETGNCTIKYPKKIFCDYNLSNNKKLISNGKSIVIKTNSSFYKYPIQRTPLKHILDKKFLINEIINLNERIVNDKFINFKIIKNENEINIFFDKKSYNLIGWQILDIYQNLSITYLFRIKKNQNLNKNLFNLPSVN